MIKPYYQDDLCTIYNADCREVLPFLKPVDLVLTDPPYGIGFGKKHTKWSANRGVILGDWDSKIPEIEFVLNYGKVVVVWGGERFGLPISRCWLSWIKPDAPPTFTSFELAWTNLDKPARWINHSISATNRERVGHPTQKPLKVMTWCINQTFPEAQTILDPFMGSGTTLRAAKDLGRKAIGIEIEKKYCDIAIERLRQEVLRFE